jgi:hypothetical protein
MWIKYIKLNFDGYYPCVNYRIQFDHWYLCVLITIIPSSSNAKPIIRTVLFYRFGYQRIPSACYQCSWCFHRINLTGSKNGFIFSYRDQFHMHKNTFLVNIITENICLIDILKNMCVLKTTIRYLNWSKHIKNALSISLIDVAFRDISHSDHSWK